jgi:hypothetical protein
VPFVLKAGKALNDKKAEIRIQLRPTPHYVFGGEPEAMRNEVGGWECGWGEEATGCLGVCDCRCSACGACVSLCPWVCPLCLRLPGGSVFDVLKRFFPAPVPAAVCAAGGAAAA